jgi:replicative DNA helicase
MIPLPHSLESEQIVLGAILCDPKLASVLFLSVKPADFYSQAHDYIASAMRKLDESRISIDKASLVQELRKANRYTEAGEVSYLSSLMDTVQTTSTAMHHASIVAEKAQLRRLIEAGGKIADRASDGESDVAAAVADCDAILRDAVGTTKSDGVSLADGAAQIYRELDKTVAGETPKAMMTPWPTINRTTGGMFPGELIVIAAAPGAGKSAMAMQIVEHVARGGKTGLVFALEMGAQDTIRRMLAVHSHLEVRRLRRGDLRGDDYDRLGAGMSDLSSLPLWFYGSYPRKSVADIRRICRQQMRESEIGVVLVDHPGYLREALLGAKNATKHERLEYVYQELKLIAEEMRTPVIAVQHLNRAGMDGKPSLAHLRDGGNLEGHAHMVLFPYRPDPLTNPSMAELIIAKNRDGDVGSVPMSFDGSMFTWREAIGVAA